MSVDKAYSFVADEPGARLDKYVTGKCPELSRTHTQKLIADGFITVNDRVARAGLKLNPGDRVSVTIPPPPPSPLSPEAIPLSIIYEDDDLIVVDKPPGLTIYPAPGHPSHTLINAILAHFPGLADTSGSVRPGIVHRLDKDTSGLMVVAKNTVAQLNLVNQFKKD